MQLHCVEVVGQPAQLREIAHGNASPFHTKALKAAPKASDLGTLRHIET